MNEIKDMNAILGKILELGLTGISVSSTFEIHFGSKNILRL